MAGWGWGGVGWLVAYRCTSCQPPPPHQQRSFPRQVLGGGNAGNACTAMARLGLRAALVAKVGADGFGQEVLRELQGDAQRGADPPPASPPGGGGEGMDLAEKYQPPGRQPIYGCCT